MSTVSTIIRDVVMSTNPGKTESGERIVGMTLAVGPAESPSDERVYVLTSDAALRLAAGLIHAVIYQPDDEEVPDEPVEAPEG